MGHWQRKKDSGKGDAEKGTKGDAEEDEEEQVRTEGKVANHVEDV